MSSNKGMAWLAFWWLLNYLLTLPFVYCGQNFVRARVTRQGDLTNFTNLISPRPFGADITPPHVVQLLKALNNKPTCYKAATHQLISSCQSTKEETLNPRPSLEDLETAKSIFAARLAICELREANTNTPSECNPLLSISLDAYELFSNNLSRSSAGQQVSKFDLRACLRALEAKPQSWTSYSNSRQHAALVCDVSRADIMKDETLSLFHVLTGLGYEICQVLLDALQRSGSQREAEIAFAEALRKLHKEHLQDMAQTQQMHKGVIRESSQLFKTLHNISEIIHSTGINASDLNRMMQAIFVSAASGEAKLAAAMLTDAKANHEIALALRETMQGVASNDVATLKGGLKEIQNLANSTREIIHDTHENSLELRESVQGISITAKQTKQDMFLLQDSTSATNAVAVTMRQTMTEIKENFAPVLELSESVRAISDALQTVFSKDTAIFLAASAFMVASVISVSCCFGLRCGCYLIAGCLQTVTAGLVVRFVPFSDWVALSISNPRASLSLIGIIAMIGLMLQCQLANKLLYVLSIRRRSQPSPPAMAKQSRTMKWKPLATNEVSYLSEQSRWQELNRSRRAQTTPPCF